MTNASEKANWLNVELSDLNEKSAKLYATYKDAASKAASIRKDFEASFIEQATKVGVVPEGFTLAFGYKFGKLSVALVPAEKPKAVTKNAFRLSK